MVTCGGAYAASPAGRAVRTGARNGLTSPSRRPIIQLAFVEAAMSPERLAETSKSQVRKLSGIGATETQMDIRATIPQRIDNKGTKVEDEAGTGEIDSSGG